MSTIHFSGIPKGVISLSERDGCRFGSGFQNLRDPENQSRSEGPRQVILTFSLFLERRVFKEEGVGGLRVVGRRVRFTRSQDRNLTGQVFGGNFTFMCIISKTFS